MKSRDFASHFLRKDTEMKMKFAPIDAYEAQLQNVGFSLSKYITTSVFLHYPLPDEERRTEQGFNRYVLTCMYVHDIVAGHFNNSIKYEEFSDDAISKITAGSDEALKAEAMEIARSLAKHCIEEIESNLDHAYPCGDDEFIKELEEEIEQIIADPLRELKEKLKPFLAVKPFLAGELKERGIDITRVIGGEVPFRYEQITGHEYGDPLSRLTNIFVQTVIAKYCDMPGSDIDFGDTVIWTAPKLIGLSKLLDDKALVAKAKDLTNHIALSFLRPYVNLLVSELEAAMLTCGYKDQYSSRALANS